MTGLVERLRGDARGGMAYHALSDEAADEIERLLAENTALRYQIGDAVCRERGAREAMERQHEAEIEQLKEERKL